MKKTNKKVKVRNGCQTFVRTVYVDVVGAEFFKHNGKNNYIYQRANGTYTAPFYNGVEFIA